MTEDEKAKYQESVDRGKALFNDPSLGTTGGTCSTCHLESGTKTNPEPMLGFTIKAFDNIGEKYPKYWLMTKKVMTLEQVINFCITNPLEGEALSLEDQRLADLTAYITSVKSHGETTETAPSPIGKTNPYWGDEGAIAEGKEIYNKNCSRCHGSDGTGLLSGQPEFTNASYWAEKTDEDLFNIVSEGKKGTSMPSFKKSLNEYEIWRVLAYEKSFSE